MPNRRVNNLTNEFVDAEFDATIVDMYKNTEECKILTRAKNYKHRLHNYPKMLAKAKADKKANECKITAEPGRSEIRNHRDNCKNYSNHNTNYRSCKTHCDINVARELVLKKKNAARVIRLKDAKKRISKYTKWITKNNKSTEIYIQNYKNDQDNKTKDYIELDGSDIIISGINLFDKFITFDFPVVVSADLKDGIDEGNNPDDWTYNVNNLLEQIQLNIKTTKNVRKYSTSNDMLKWINEIHPDEKINETKLDLDKVTGFIMQLISVDPVLAYALYDWVMYDAVTIDNQLDFIVNHYTRNLIIYINSKNLTKCATNRYCYLVYVGCRWTGKKYSNVLKLGMSDENNSDRTDNHKNDLAFPFVLVLIKVESTNPRNLEKEMKAFMKGCQHKIRQNKSRMKVGNKKEWVMHTETYYFDDINKLYDLINHVHDTIYHESANIDKRKNVWNRQQMRLIEEKRLKELAEKDRNHAIELKEVEENFNEYKQDILKNIELGNMIINDILAYEDKYLTETNLTDNIHIYENQYTGNNDGTLDLISFIKHRKFDRAIEVANRYSLRPSYQAYINDGDSDSD